jgi:hypothetical protein
MGHSIILKNSTHNIKIEQQRNEARSCAQTREEDYDKTIKEMKSKNKGLEDKKAELLEENKGLKKQLQ